jgi:pimeloyl-ACP methyl ester carboxylesterase
MTASNGVDRFMVGAADGRSLEVFTAGPPDGLPVVFHTGTPSGLIEFQPRIDAATAHGLRTVQYARPGYGKSDSQPGRRVADAAADVEAILDHLGAAEFVTAGWSGGGPHTLATAALLPGRCLAVASIAGCAPYGADDLDWTAGMAAENIAEFNAALAGESEITALLQAEARKLANVTAEQITQALGGLASAADRAVLTGEYATYSAASFRAAVSTGVIGWRDDDLAFVHDWGFSLDGLGSALPVCIWQGDQDAMVPFAHGQWLAARISQAHAHLLAGEGHLTLSLTSLDAIFGELAELAVRH